MNSILAQLEDLLDKYVEITHEEKIYKIVKNRLDKKICVGSGNCILSIKDLIDIKHPILRKLINKTGIIGNLSNALRKDKELTEYIEQLVNILKKQQGVSQDVNVILTKMRKRIKDLTIKFIITSATDSKKKYDLRPLNIPGSLARSEIPNLYYASEKYDEKEKILLFYYLLDSIILTRNFLIRFYGELHEHLKHIIYSRFSPIEPLDEFIGINNWEREYPYIALIRFIVWLYEDVLNLEKTGEYKELLELLRNGSGVIYVITDNKEEWRVEAFPQLTVFIDKWILDRHNRTRLDRMFKVFSAIVRTAYRKSKMKKKVSDEATILYNYLEIVARMLMFHGTIEWEAFRKALDIASSISLEYEIRNANFSFIKLFEIRG